MFSIMSNTSYSTNELIGANDWQGRSGLPFYSYHLWQMDTESMEQALQREQEWDLADTIGDPQEQPEEVDESE